MKRFREALDVAATICVIAAAGLLAWRQLAPSSKGAPAAQDAKGIIAAEVVKNSRGTGAIALVEFADYECPFCGRHAREVGPALNSQFVKNGIVTEVFVNFPLQNHAEAQKASEAAECAAEQGRFWEMHESLFSPGGSLARAGLLARAQTIGLDAPRFSQCLDSGATAGIVEQHKKAGQQLSISGTPAFLLGVVREDGSIEVKRRLNGALPLDLFEQEISRLAPAQPVAVDKETRKTNSAE
jgi:protein-disulfide isomerase